MQRHQLLHPAPREGTGRFYRRVDCCIHTVLHMSGGDYSCVEKTVGVSVKLWSYRPAGRCVGCEMARFKNLTATILPPPPLLLRMGLGGLLAGLETTSWAS